MSPAPLRALLVLVVLELVLVAGLMWDCYGLGAHWHDGPAPLAFVLAGAAFGAGSAWLIAGDWALVSKLPVWLVMVLMCALPAVAIDLALTGEWYGPPRMVGLGFWLVVGPELMWHLWTRYRTAAERQAIFDRAFRPRH